MKNDTKLQVLDVPSLTHIVALLQHNNLFANTKLRQIVAYAVDRKSIAENIMGGVNLVGTSSLPTNVPPNQPLKPDFAYDPDKAASLVKEAAFPSGIDVTIATTTLLPNQLEIDQAISASLEQVGFRVKIQRLVVGAFYSSYKTCDISVNTLASLNDDADFLLDLYTGCAAAAIWHYKDEDFGRLQAAQRASTGHGLRTAVSAAASHLWDDQVGCTSRINAGTQSFPAGSAVTRARRWWAERLAAGASVA